MKERTRFPAWLWLPALCLPSPVAIAENVRALDCRAARATEVLRWQVELDPEHRVARVDGHPADALFGNSHAQVRLADGLTLVIGLASGRLVITDVQGRTVAAGGCTAQPTA